jgi:hypothetical protein
MIFMKTVYRRLSLISIISVSLVAPLCAENVKVYPNRHADFAHYKTYQWLPPRVLTKAGIDENNPANPIIKEVIAPQLSQKGLTEVADGADLQVQVWVLTEVVPYLEAIIMASVSIEVSDSGVTTSDYTEGVVNFNREGSLYVNLIDTRTKKSAWLGMVKDSLPPREVLKPEDIRKKLQKAATDLFKKYPKK